ncbi:MAG: agmatinase family protein [Prevotellaceae bacterium]|jgi:agmatinase|nr:agmatinase family protein [Prevotellaceae bacterium]
MAFNPNSAGIPNGRYFALPFTADNALLALLPVPWDVTTSYRPGAAKGPQAMLDASPQVDLFDLDNGNAWTSGICTLPESAEIRRLGKAARSDAEKVIALLEKGADEGSPQLKPCLDRVNQASATLNSWVYGQTAQRLRSGQLVGLVGGDHSAPLGCIQALGEVHESFGILHIDAHADLRKAYEGFEFSHASIMYNVMQRVPAVKKLVQVGIRDLCADEAALAAANPLIAQFNDYYLHENLFNGVAWADLCDKILAFLPQKVYISFDIDGLSPDCCPHTGTPAPGGLTFHQASFLIKQLVKQGKTIVGFDLCEVAPGRDGSEWDAIVGARMLYKLCGFCIRSHGDRPNRAA